MRRIKDSKLFQEYIDKYNINNIFTNSLEDFMELVIFSKGEYICREGEPIDYLFFFVKGKAKVYMNLVNGKSLLLCFYNPFMMLGDLEVITCGMATTNTEVVDEVHCLALPLIKVREELLKDAKFLKFTCESLGSKLERASKNGSINLLYPLVNRVASYIVATMEEVKDENGEFEFKENLTAISELLGTSYRHLLRTLNNLVENKILAKVKGGYMVMNESELRTLAEDVYK